MTTGDSPSPEPLTAAALRETLESLLQEQMGVVVAHVDKQVGGLEARLASLEQRPLDLQPVVDKVVAVLGPDLSKQVNERLQERAASTVQASPNGHSPESQAVAGAVGQTPSLAAKADDLLSVVGAVADVVLGKLYPLYLDHRKETRLDRQEARADKLMDVNPFAVADAMRAANNPMLPMYAAAFAPTPQSIAEARTRETTDAMVVGMRARAEATRILREEQLRQRETPSPSSPSSSGSPTSTSTPSPTNPNEQKPGSVSMSSKESLPLHRKPRLTLRAVMG